jgi:hypothetical protein
VIEVIMGRFDRGRGKPLVLTLLANVLLPDTVGLLWLCTETLAEPLAELEEELDDVLALVAEPTLMS